MRLTFYPYTLRLRQTFSISTYSRTTTPAVQVELEHDSVVGYGEAAMPQYLGETVDSVMAFLSRVDMEQFDDPFVMEDILSYVSGVGEGNHAAKAAIDIALHDLTGKLLGVPCYKLFGLDKRKAPVTSYTIGIGGEAETRDKVSKAGRDFKLLKVKIGTDHDRQIISLVRQYTDLPLIVDANQGWHDLGEAIEMSHWLKEQNVLLIEQPMKRGELDMTARLREESLLPIFADESVQTAQDIFGLKGVFDGINVKLMKCGGMREARKMIDIARTLGMNVMLGCMTETSCAISAAAQLAPAVDFADLDGNLLIGNDIFSGVGISDGKIMLNDRAGIGVVRLTDDAVAL